MTALKELAQEWLPPVAIRWFKTIRHGSENRFEGPFATWEEARAKCTGYDATEILARVLASTLKVKRGEAAFERDSVVFTDTEYAWPVLAGLMWAAARSRGRLNVLDFGGALGSSYFQNYKFLQTLPDVRWSIVEQHHYVEAGKAQIQNEHLRFYQTIEECLSENEPKVILLSSVLQYLPSPSSVLLELNKVNADAIVIDRTIVNQSTFDRVYVQHVPASIYTANYPCWSLSEPALLAGLGKHYLPLADFPSLNFPALKSIKSEFKGYIFLRQTE